MPPSSESDRDRYPARFFGGYTHSKVETDSDHFSQHTRLLAADWPREQEGVICPEQEGVICPRCQGSGEDPVTDEDVWGGDCGCVHQICSLCMGDTLVSPEVFEQYRREEG